MTATPKDRKFGALLLWEVTGPKKKRLRGKLLEPKNQYIGISRKQQSGNFRLGVPSRVVVIAIWDQWADNVGNKILAHGKGTKDRGLRWKRERMAKKSKQEPLYQGVKVVTSSGQQNKDTKRKDGSYRLSSLHAFRRERLSRVWHKHATRNRR